MNLSWLSPLAFGAGLVGLAGALFVLQRLRVRHRVVQVPTTLFWREAVQETRARVFVQRFRHPWTYVLLLAIAALLWSAVAGPHSDSARGREHVLLLDASADMQVGSRFDAARTAMIDRAAQLPRGSTRVLVAGAHVRTLLDRGEDLPLLARRAESLQPEPCPATFDRAIESLLATSTTDDGIAVELFGEAPVDPALVQRGAKRVDVRRGVVSRPTQDLAPNMGITALGISDAASGDWTRVDVFVRARVPAAVSPRVTLDGADVPVTWTRDDAGASGVVRDVIARGGRVEASVPSGDPVMADDRAARMLPDRAPLTVALSPTVPAVLKDALVLDGGLAITTDESTALIVVRRGGETFGGDRPALVLSDEAAQAPAFLVRHPESGDDARDLRAAFRALGLDEIDATGIAQAAQKPVSLSFESAPTRSVSVWSSLFDPGYDFTATRAYPLFLARTLRWLAGVPDVDSQLAAGVPCAAASTPWKDDRGRTVDTLGSAASFPVVGRVRDARGREQDVALLDEDATALRRDASALPAATDARVTGTFDPLPWIVLAALALLAVEWWLFQKERIA